MLLLVGVPVKGVILSLRNGSKLAVENCYDEQHATAAKRINFWISTKCWIWQMKIKMEKNPKQNKNIHQWIWNIQCIYLTDFFFFVPYIHCASRWFTSYCNSSAACGITIRWKKEICLTKGRKKKTGLLKRNDFRAVRKLKIINTDYSYKDKLMQNYCMCPCSTVMVNPLLSIL